MYKKGTGNDKQGKDAGNRMLCPYRNFSQAINAIYTTVVRGCGMYEKLVKLYKIKSIAMFRNFIAKRGGGGGGGGGNVMIHKSHLTFHKNTEWMKIAATPHY